MFDKQHWQNFAAVFHCYSGINRVNLIMGSTYYGRTIAIYVIIMALISASYQVEQLPASAKAVIECSSKSA